MPDHPGAKSSGELARVVGRPVVDDDALEIGPRRVSEPLETPLEAAAPVVDGDHDRQR